ncbi:MAG: lipid-A-disaccharide synthase [Polyangiales bacterium]
MRRTALMVCGEPSGDRLLASIARALDPGLFSSVFGVCGEAMEAAQIEAVADARALGAMGLMEGVRSLPTIAATAARVVAAIERRRPEVAILASWSAPNARLGAWLRTRGVRVMWIAPPEIWAWGRMRGARLSRAADRFVVTLPFEVELWRGLGADARYFGHPTSALARPSREEARARLGLADDVLAVGVLPGSRASEIDRLAPPMLDAARALARRNARVRPLAIVAPSMNARARATLLRLAQRADVECVEAPAATGALEVLPALDAAMVASGTASLECAIAEVPAVVCYALHPLTHALAKRLVDTPVIALPNVLRVRAGLAPIFPERVQRDVNAARLIADVEALLQRAPHVREECASLRRSLGYGSFATGVAAWIAEEGWRRAPSAPLSSPR